jgi:hypothetical protein
MAKIINNLSNEDYISAGDIIIIDVCGEESIVRLNLTTNEESTLSISSNTYIQANSFKNGKIAFDGFKIEMNTKIKELISIINNWNSYQVKNYYKNNEIEITLNERNALQTS